MNVQDYLTRIQSDATAALALLNQPPAGTVVTTSAELTAALLQGGSITVQPGTYIGSFVISVLGTSLSGTKDAILQPDDPTQVTLSICASQVHVTGISIHGGTGTAVEVGDPAATTEAAQPDSVTLAGITVVAPGTGAHRGVSLHGTNLMLTSSQVLGYWLNGQDAQAVWGNNGAGPYEISACYLEGAANAILFGGDTIRIPNCLPSNIMIKDNVCTKPTAWRTNGATVKNAIEIKVGVHVLIDGNTCDGCWTSGQDGTPIVITVRNQNNDTPWALVDDVTISNNVTKNCVEGKAVNILGSDDTYPSQQTQTITIKHNLFTDSPRGIYVNNGVAKALIVTNNTFPGIVPWDSTFLYFIVSNGVKSPLTFTANALKAGQYGIMSDGMAPGQGVLDQWAAPYMFSDNFIELNSGDTQFPLPSGNTLLAAGGLAPLMDPTTFKMLPPNTAVGY